MNNIMLREQMEILFQLIEEHEISDPVRTNIVDLSVDQQVETLLNEGERAREALRALGYIKDGLANDITKAKEKIEKLSAIEARLKSQIIEVIKFTPGLDWKAVGFRVQKNSAAPIAFKSERETVTSVVPNPQDFPQDYIEEKKIFILKKEFTQDLKSGLITCEGAQVQPAGEHLRLL